MFLVVGWILIAYLMYKVLTTTDISTPFDPFEILGVSSSATEPEIKAAYRSLSRQHHPDKNPNDPTAKDRFILISKAHDSLIDETARENYAKYGHPDGYQGTKFGVPTIMKDQGNALLVIYFLCLVVIFPLVVGLWWRSQSHKLQTSISIKTYYLFREVLSHTGKFRDLLTAYSSASEFEHFYKNDNPRRWQSIQEGLKKTKKFDLKKARFVSPLESYMVQNYLLLSAYLNRLEVPNSLVQPLNVLLEWAEPLTSALADSNGNIPRRDVRNTYRRYVNGYSSRITTSLQLCQSFCQALNEKESPLFQLPGFTAAEVKFCQSRANHIFSVYDFAATDDVKRQKVLRSFTEDELLDVNEFCLRYPRAVLEVEEPKVEDEVDQTVHEFDTVTVSVKLKLSRGAGSACSPCLRRYPAEKEEVWWIVLGDHERDLPLDVKKLKPADAEEEGVYKVTTQFTAPVKGKYEYVVHAVCDCYVGCDVFHTFKFSVLDKAQIEETRRYFDTDDESEKGLLSDTSEESLTDEEVEEPEEDTAAAPVAKFNGEVASDSDYSDEGSAD